MGGGECLVSDVSFVIIILYRYNNNNKTISGRHFKIIDTNTINKRSTDIINLT